MVKSFPRTIENRIRRRLHRLYGDRAKHLFERLYMLSGRYGVGLDAHPPEELWDESDTVLITYADNVRAKGEPGLQTLRQFCVERLHEAIRTVHLLPFYPWSSDDGFSVINYREVKEDYGSWQDVEALGEPFDLLFDLVLNHVSSQSSWFKDFVAGVYPASSYILTMDPQADLSQVVRPRPTPVLTKTVTRDGEKYVWTTFSADQVDLDWSNPDVLFEFLDIIMGYVSRGARILRLDAVAFLWKREGTSCIHLEETHEMVKLIRDFLEAVAPHVLVLTETNVPHEENISYFGQGNEAHMVYNFTLPPLLLHGLLRGTCKHLRDWAASLPALPAGCTFFNFTASHDGVGVRPLQGILQRAELDWLMGEMQRRGGKVNYKAESDGSKSPYELNITYYSALSEPENETLGRERFLCSQAVMLALKGMPAVYFHSLTGTENWEEGVEALGYNRAINRYKWDKGELDLALDDPENPRAKTFEAMLHLLRTRRKQPAFHPDGDMRVFDLGETLFGFTRTDPEGRQTILCLYNFSAKKKTVKLDDLYGLLGTATQASDLLGGVAKIDLSERKTFSLSPYQPVWLELAGDGSA